MKITIDVKDSDTFGLSPCYVYKTLWTEYWNNLTTRTGKKLFAMASACDRIARTQYAYETGRNENIKNLILTYHDAENCFNLFKQYAEIWAKNAKK